MRSHELARRLLALPDSDVAVPREDGWRRVTRIRRYRLHVYRLNELDQCMSTTYEPVPNCYACSTETTAVIAIALS